MKRIWTTILAAKIAITLCTTTAVANNLLARTEQTASTTDAIIEGTFNEIFPDPNLAKAIAKEFGRDVTDHITIAELNNKTGTLELIHSKISDLGGIQYFIGIHRLDVASNQIRNISTLSELENLQHLNIGYNQISDISALSGLNKLTYNYS